MCWRLTATPAHMARSPPFPFKEEIILWVVEIAIWLVDAIASCFIRNDDEWSVGRIVFVFVIVIAIVGLGYLLYR